MDGWLKEIQVARDKDGFEVRAAQSPPPRGCGFPTLRTVNSHCLNLTVHLQRGVFGRNLRDLADRRTLSVLVSLGPTELGVSQAPYQNSQRKSPAGSVIPEPCPLIEKTERSVQCQERRGGAVKRFLCRALGQVPTSFSRSVEGWPPPLEPDQVPSIDAPEDPTLCSHRPGVQKVL